MVTTDTKHDLKASPNLLMNELVVDYPDQEIHVILDNLNTHKPKIDRWLPKHPNVHLYYTPTHASWLNEVEIWFSILWKRALRNASFTSIQQVRQAITEFTEVYNGRQVIHEKCHQCFG